MTSNTNIEITIIIPNYNNRQLLANLLESLKQVKTPHDIIIVDNASSDDSVDFIKTNYPEINLIENSTNTGFAHAVNQGIKIANTRYVFLLNNDTIVDQHALEELLKTIRKDELIFSVSSKMIQYHNPDLIDDAGDEYNIIGWTKKRGFNKSIKKYSQDSEVFSACAGAAMYKRELFSKIGYFDEDFESYVEDVDLSFRARLMGYKSYYCANALIYHYGSASSGSQYNQFKVRISARNNIYLIYKNMSLWMKIINSIFILLGIIIKYIFFSNKNFGSYYINGIREGFNTRKKLQRIENIPFSNYLRIELSLIKNAITYLWK